MQEGCLIREGLDVKERVEKQMECGIPELRHFINMN